MSAPQSPETLPPGTIQLLQLPDNELQTNGELILVPSPSDHLDDPLNWQKWRKTLHICCVYFYVFTTGVAATSNNSLLASISEDTGLKLTDLNLGVGIAFLFAGWANIFWQPLAMTIGRRPVFLLSLLGCLAITEWTAWIGSFGQWEAARIMYGFFIAPVEVLPEISIPDTYFAHERGTYVGLYSLILNGGNFIGPFISGFMNDALGWRWVQHWCALLLAFNFIIALFLQEESMFERENVRVEPARIPVAEGEVREQQMESVSSPALKQSDTNNWWKKMKLYKKSHISWGNCTTMFYRPFLIFALFPNVMWASFQYAFTNAWYSVYNATVSSFLSSVPYSYPTTVVGTTYLAPLLGAIIGGVYAGPLSDKFSLMIARHNGGLMEPEHRLWGMGVYTLIMPLGLFMWGIGAARKAPVAVLLCGSVFCGFGTVTGGSYAIAYNVDSFKEIAGESMVSLILCRNTVTFAFSYAITPWIQRSGTENTFIAAGIVAFATGSLFLVMIWKGKVFRTLSQARYCRYAATQVIHH